MDLIDLDEVLGLVGESHAVFWTGVQVRRWPRPEREYEFAGVDGRGKKLWRFSPRWRRGAVTRAIEELRRRAALLQAKSRQN